MALEPTQEPTLGETTPLSGEEGFVLPNVLEHMAEALEKRILKLEQRVSEVERLIGV